MLRASNSTGGPQDAAPEARVLLQNVDSLDVGIPDAEPQDWPWREKKFFGEN
jgi:hypothetical protein